MIDIISPELLESLMWSAVGFAGGFTFGRMHEQKSSRRKDEDE